jgi:hypothetical protein
MAAATWRSFSRIAYKPDHDSFLPLPLTLRKGHLGTGKDSGLCRIQHKPDHVGLWTMSDSSALSLSKPKSAGV